MLVDVLLVLCAMTALLAVLTVFVVIAVRTIDDRRAVYDERRLRAAQTASEFRRRTAPDDVSCETD